VNDETRIPELVSEVVRTPDTSVFASIAEGTGVAFVVYDDKQENIFSHNDNSICVALYSSEEFGPKCAEDCGRAIRDASRSAQVSEYKCHAGLVCKAAGFDLKGQRLSAIVGRAFRDTSDYRTARRRAIEGDWSKIASTVPFDNVLFDSSDDVEALLRRIEALDDGSVPEPALSRPALDISFELDIPGEAEKPAAARPVQLAPLKLEQQSAPCEKCGAEMPANQRICDCGYWPEKGVDLSPGPGLDDIQRRKKTARIGRWLVVPAAAALVLFIAYSWTSIESFFTTTRTDAELTALAEVETPAAIPETAMFNGPFEGRPLSAITGDTITLEVADKGKKTVRLAGISAPKLNERFGIASREHLSGLVDQKVAVVDTAAIDPNGWIVGRVTADGKNINLEQVKAGFAIVSDQASLYYADAAGEFANAEAAARSKKIGIWAAPAVAVHPVSAKRSGLAPRNRPKTSRRSPSARKPIPAFPAPLTNVNAANTLDPCSPNANSNSRASNANQALKRCP
jgi:endonuclease YncB( thermonuclease family)/ligand-binding sensor protein